MAFAEGDQRAPAVKHLVKPDAWMMVTAMAALALGFVLFLLLFG